jgi:G3E family GTPase
MIPFYLITGFLGSGKTTLLKNILATYSNDHRIAVLQNEFASTGVDGKELQKTGYDFILVEINNGSVFCVCMLGTFIQSLEKVIEHYRPDFILLEASGLADPINIIELLQSDNVKNHLALQHIFTVVDAVNFDKGMASFTRFKHQLMIADAIILNKSDLKPVDKHEFQDQMQRLNPFARIIYTSFCNVSFESFFDKATNEQRAASMHAGRKSEGRPDISSCVLRTNDLFLPEGLNLFISELQTQCPRIKGFLKLKNGAMAAVQTVYNDIQMEEIPSFAGPGELIAFGKNISAKELRQKAKKYSMT